MIFIGVTLVSKMNTDFKSHVCRMSVRCNVFTRCRFFHHRGLDPSTISLPPLPPSPVVTTKLSSVSMRFCFSPVCLVPLGLSVFYLIRLNRPWSWRSGRPFTSHLGSDRRGFLNGRGLSDEKGMGVSAPTSDIPLRISRDHGASSPMQDARTRQRPRNASSLHRWAIRKIVMTWGRVTVVLI